MFMARRAQPHSAHAVSLRKHVVAYKAHGMPTKLMINPATNMHALFNSTHSAMGEKAPA